MTSEIRTILHPTDLSRAAQQALPYALSLTEKYGASLHILHARVLHEDEPDKEDLPGQHGILSRLFEIADPELRKLIPPERTGALAVTEAVRPGYSAPEVILDYAADAGADLIVIGSHGRRGPARFFLGSVAAAVVRHANCSVLMTRETAQPRRPGRWQTILAPVDFSEPSRRALTTAVELAKVYKARLQLLWVNQVIINPYFYSPNEPEQWEQRAKKALEKLAAELVGDAVDHEIFIGKGRPAGEIARFADWKESDLVVIASHGLGGLKGNLLGSTTTEVLRRVKCPVLTVKAPWESPR